MWWETRLVETRYSLIFVSEGVPADDGRLLDEAGLGRVSVVNESWAEEVTHPSRLHEALLGASPASCATITQRMTERERKLGLTHEEAVARGVLPIR